MEEKRKQAMDMHLNFIVDQTEKYSSWLIESLAANNAQPSSGANVGSGGLVEEMVVTSEPPPQPPPLVEAAQTELEDDADVEFDQEKLNEDSDDESTIEKEELLEVTKIL